MPSTYTIKIRRDTSANWASVNPILASGEMGLDTTLDKVKFGNGVSHWNDLAFSIGSTGLAGKTILHGTAAPTTEGNDGDFYIRTTTNYLYGPKAGGVWPAGVSLVGPQGATGATGAQGPQGTIVTAASLSVSVLTEDTTINFTSDMTSAQIQALIDAQPKNLNGHTLTFQFGDGTYTLNAQLAFKMFIGGYVFIKGNPSETGAHTNQAVTLDCSTGAILIDNCSYVNVVNIKFTVADITNTALDINNTPRSQVYGCYFIGDGKTADCRGVSVQWNSNSLVYDCKFSNLNFGIVSQFNSRIDAVNNSTTGTTLNWGNDASSGSVLAIDGTMATGTVNFATRSGSMVMLQGGAFPAAAWVNFNGVTGAIRASGNVSSITKNGTGDYTINFTNAMPDANYAAVVSATGPVNQYHVVPYLGQPGSNDNSSHATNGLRCSFYNTTNSVLRADPLYVCVAIFR